MNANHGISSVAPSAPPTAIAVDDVSSRHVNISWGPPPAEEQNGVINLYQINLAFSDKETLFKEVLVFSTALTTIYISDLLPYHNYTFTVVAITLEHGPLSVPVNFQTLEDGKMLFMIQL